MHNVDILAIIIIVHPDIQTRKGGCPYSGRHQPPGGHILRIKIDAGVQKGFAVCEGVVNQRTHNLWKAVTRFVARGSCIRHRLATRRTQLSVPLSQQSEQVALQPAQGSPVGAIGEAARNKPLLSRVQRRFFSTK